MTESPKRKAIIAFNHTNKQNKNQTHHGPSSQQIKDSNDIRLCYPETIKINTSKEEKQLCMGCHSTSCMDGPFSISQDENRLASCEGQKRRERRLWSICQSPYWKTGLNWRKMGLLVIEKLSFSFPCEQKGLRTNEISYKIKKDRWFYSHFWVIVCQFQCISPLTINLQWIFCT